MTCAFLIGAPDILLTTEPSTVALGAAASTGGMYARQTEKKRRHFVMKDKLFATLVEKLVADLEPRANLSPDDFGRLKTVHDPGTFLANDPDQT